MAGGAFPIIGARLSIDIVDAGGVHPDEPVRRYHAPDDLTRLTSASGQI